MSPLVPVADRRPSVLRPLPHQNRRLVVQWTCLRPCFSFPARIKVSSASLALTQHAPVPKPPVQASPSFFAASHNTIQDHGEENRAFRSPLWDPSLQVHALRRSRSVSRTYCALREWRCTLVSFMARAAAAWSAWSGAFRTSNCAVAH